MDDQAFQFRILFPELLPAVVHVVLPEDQLELLRVLPAVNATC